MVLKRRGATLPLPLTALSQVLYLQAVAIAGIIRFCVAARSNT